ncbi:hypothetical protein H0266_05635 [Halobacillus locisalis]|uniref:Uncharacterized protein n=1 Tax=Halobacillus locisalis TaxID=220753 RepID=A0A838CRJ5_9BACI|nr:hypothetical protein [Halobacillus locisalis]MBA2174385.1 hypothetical protein [Halobacillus locisalis]
MTIQFFIFTVTISARRKKKYPPIPGYHPTAEDQWLDRKSLFNHYL